MLNEGGLYGERQGWHLPGFDTSSWETRDLSEGLPSGGAGVGFFVTKFDLDLPAGMDIQLSFQFEPFNEQPYRALLFVNGWQYGKVSPGIPCNRGVSNIDDRERACSVWRTSGHRRGSQYLRVYSSTTAKSEWCGSTPCGMVISISVFSTVAVALWVLEDTKVSPMLQLSIDGAFDGGVGPIKTVAPTYAEVRE